MLVKSAKGNIILILLLTIPFLQSFIHNLLFDIEINISYLILPVFLISLLELKIYLMNYRIKKGYWGTNEHEAREVIYFILKNSEKIDFTDDDGKPKKLVNLKDLKEEPAFVDDPGVIGVEA